MKAIKGPKAIAELKFQHLMKPTPQRIQDHALNAMDPTFKIDAQNTEINLVKETEHIIYTTKLQQNQ